jgi:two-component system cell cycle sensor histidine kinase/response regulator CckA
MASYKYAYNGCASCQFGVRPCMTAEQTSTTDYAQKLIEQLPGVVYVADIGPGRCCRYVSPQIEALLGYSPSEWTGDPTLWSERVHPDDARRWEAARSRCIETGEPIDVQYRILDKRGRLVWVHDRATVVGPPSEVCGFMTDITARKSAQLVSRQQESNLMATLDQLPVILWTTDTSLRFTSARGGGLGHLNLDENQVVDMTVYEYFGTGDDTSPLVAPHIAALAGETMSYEVNWQNRAYEAHVEPMRSATGEIIGVIGVATDVTERKQLEERIRQALKMEALGRLAGSVAHDFNNIMAVILNYARFLNDDLDATDQHAKDVREILRAAERARGLINQLLTFSRSDTSIAQTVSLNDVVHGMEGLVRRTIGESIQLELRLSPELWHICGDPAHIEHALLNLVLNARDAMPSGGKLTIETANEMRGKEPHKRHPRPYQKPYVRLSVVDTGVGMTPDVMSRAFEPFFTTKASGEGTGLGLASVYGIVEQSGGLVSVDSTPGEGSAFHLFFPAKEGSAVEE